MIFLYSFIIILGFFLFVFLLFFYSKESQEANYYPFECGFNTLSEGGSFEVSFFIMSLIFILFEVEIVLLGFHIVIHNAMLQSFLVLPFMFFLLLKEWGDGFLKWLI